MELGYASSVLSLSSCFIRCLYHIVQVILDTHNVSWCPLPTGHIQRLFLAFHPLALSLLFPRAGVFFFLCGHTPTIYDLFSSYNASALASDALVALYLPVLRLNARWSFSHLLYPATLPIFSP